jgi:proteasome alpha subunit
MTMPFYVSPEQIMKDKSDYARKGIARGRSVLALQYADGILFIGENPNGALHKISEIYDRIAFAAVGKYNEFENLRLAGVRYADLRGYQYDRRDVTSRGLANAYAQTLGTIFTESGKPYEVELVVAEVGDTQAEDQMYRLTYDGSVAEEHGFIVMGGNSDPIASHVRERHDPTAPLAPALHLAIAALVQPVAEGADIRTLAGTDLEAAVLDRTRPRRAFKRLVGAPLQTLLDTKA